MTKKLSSLWLVLLVVFMPFSAWLVSFTGHATVALGRDILLALLILTTVWVMKPPKRRPLFILALLFIGWGLLSYFWREESLDQWLRGIRFVLEPVILFWVILLAAHKMSRRYVWIFLGLSAAATILLGYGEYFHPELVRYTLGSGLHLGNLEQIHLAGDWQRMQSTLAGPNALGLYLMIVLLVSPMWLKKVNRYVGVLVVIAGLAALVLTFSRSCYLGLGAGLIALVAVMWPLYPRWRWAYVTVLIIGALVASLLAYKTPSGLLRPNSNQIRLDQYERVWQERYDIGLLGRGIGSAGLVSQYRFDGGQNNYTENTYLDMFEALGLVGALSYLSLWFVTLWSLFRKKDFEAKVIGAAGVGILVAGLFINHYTGQAAIWMFWLLAGLALAKLEPDNGEDWA